MKRGQAGPIMISCGPVETKAESSICLGMILVFRQSWRIPLFKWQNQDFWTMFAKIAEFSKTFSRVEYKSQKRYKEYVIH